MGSGYSAGQGLIEVMMGVDQTGKKDMTIFKREFVGILLVTLACSDLLYKAIPDKQTAIDNLAFLVIEGS